MSDDVRMNAFSNQMGSILFRLKEHSEYTHECASLMSGSEPWVTLLRTYPDCVRILHDDLNEVYVAVKGEELVGFAVIKMAGAFTGYIQSIVIVPQWRNKGLGKQFIAYLEKRIFLEKPNVFICASSFNTEALRLYRNLGYEVIGELRDYIVSGHSEIILRKTLGPLKGYRNTRTGDAI